MDGCVKSGDLSGNNVVWYSNFSLVSEGVTLVTGRLRLPLGLFITSRNLR